MPTSPGELGMRSGAVVLGMDPRAAGRSSSHKAGVQVPCFLAPSPPATLLGALCAEGPEPDSGLGPRSQPVTFRPVSSPKPHSWEPLNRKQRICRATSLGSPGADSLLCCSWDPPGRGWRKWLCGGLGEEGGSLGSQEVLSRGAGAGGTREGLHAGKVSGMEQSAPCGWAR